MRMIQDKMIGKVNYKDKAQRMLAGYAKFWCGFIVVFFMVVLFLNIVKTQAFYQSEIEVNMDTSKIETLDGD